MYADDLNNTNIQEPQKTLWSKESMPTIRKLLLFEKQHPGSHMSRFSRIRISEIFNVKNCTFHYYYKPIKTCTEQEWLSGKFIKTMMLDGNNRFFGLNSTCKAKPQYLGKNIKPQELKLTSDMSNHFYLIKTDYGYNIKLFKLKKN